MSRNIWRGIIVVIIIAAGAWWYNQSSMPATSITETPITPQTSAVQNQQNINASQTPAQPSQTAPQNTVTNQASQNSTSVSGAGTIAATIDVSSLAPWTLNSAGKVISGSASGVKSLTLAVLKSGQTADQGYTYASDTVVVTNGRWSVTIPASQLGCNSYDVYVNSGNGTQLEKSSFTVTGCTTGQ